MTDELRTLRRRALKFANTLRELDGREPLPALIAGHALDCARCPIASTANMGLRRDVSQWEVGHVAVKVSKAGNPQKGTQVPVPESALAFMAAFDAGEFPELEARQAVAA